MRNKMSDYMPGDERTLRFSHFTIERAPDAVLWIDSEGSIYRANEEARRMLGYTNEELLGVKIYDLTPDDNEEKWHERWLETRKTKKLTFEWTYLSKKGKLIPVEVMRNFIEFEGKEYSCSFIHDITDRKKKQEALENALAEIKILKDRLREENIYLQSEIKLTHNFEQIVGKSKKLKQVLSQVEQVANTDSTVLLLGETGTGKELIARAIHNISRRNERPLVKVNCAAIPVNLIESELFGHEKGAFTGAFERQVGRFEIADKGTLFLDEIGDLSIEIQTKLLRVLQDEEFERLGRSRTIRVDVRIIAATNRNLEKAVENASFREDLFYRLNVFPIIVPALRERKEDIPILVNHFVKKYEKKIGKKIGAVPKKVMDRLLSYSWPGNIRELENVIERSIIISKGEFMDLGNWVPRKETTTESKKRKTLAELEKDYIEETLEMTHWKVSGRGGAADALGLNHNTLVSKMKKLGIRR